MENKTAIIPQALKYEMQRLIKHPCVQCGCEAQAVAAFRPKHPERFGMRQGDNKALFFPCCRKCVEAGLDIETIELDAMATLGFFVV